MIPSAIEFGIAAQPDEHFHSRAVYTIEGHKGLYRRLSNKKSGKSSDVLAHVDTTVAVFVRWAAIDEQLTAAGYSVPVTGGSDEKSNTEGGKAKTA